MMCAVSGNASTCFVHLTKMLQRCQLSDMDTIPCNFQGELKGDFANMRGVILTSGKCMMMLNLKHSSRIDVMGTHLAPVFYVYNNPANSVESEQILSSATWDTSSDKIFSFTQFRGSIPLFFSQSPYSLKPQVTT